MRGASYITVSNAALCQRCPMLLAYKIHMGFDDVWKIGINGSGFAYGSMFHKNIAQVFFDAASNPSHRLHRKISEAIPLGLDSLEGIIRENIFMPFVSRQAKNYASGQILSMAKGITVWTRAMSEFFSLIPSLLRDTEKNMRTVFIPPEQKLQALYESGGVKLNVTGCYDALLFNPDRCEARLFEFKGYMRSDIVVPLSQSLIYSWLIWKHTGIIPSVEIIYLGDDDKEPEVFSSSSVKEMICAGLPGLFESVAGIISLSGSPEISRDKKLCRQCPFDGKCAEDWRSLKMRKRRGASLINVMVFLMFAGMITAQVFFFSRTSADSLAEGREIMLYRLQLQSLVEEAKDKLKIQTEQDGAILHDSRLHNASGEPRTMNAIDVVKYNEFYDKTTLISNSDDSFPDTWKNNGYHVRIHDLDYSFDATGFDSSSRSDWVENYGNSNAEKKLFAAMYVPVMSEDVTRNASGDITAVTHRYYLIRAHKQLPANYYGRKLMYQVLIRRNENNHQDIQTLSFQEVWY